MEEVLVYHEHLIANVEPTECFPLVENVAKGIVEWKKSWLQERERAEGFFFPFFLVGIYLQAIFSRLCFEVCVADARDISCCRLCVSLEFL